MAFRYRPYHVIWMWLVILVSGYVSASAQNNTTNATATVNTTSYIWSSVTLQASSVNTSAPRSTPSVQTSTSTVSITSGFKTAAPSLSTAAIGPSPSQTQILSTILPTSSASVNQTATSASVNQTVTPSPTTCWACKSRACRNIQGPWCLVTFLLGISLLIIVHAIF